jgi:CheY-like chemotaxis protein
MKKVNKKLIFIVEDSVDIRELITLFYESEGYEVGTAANGQQALDTLHSLEELPSFLLLDLMMPTMDGYEFRKLQEKDSILAGIPIVVMTADSNASTRAISLGAHGYIKKPVDLSSLIDIASKFCV